MTSYDIMMPQIGGATVQNKVEQIDRYLHQMVGQLNWALNAIASGDSTEIIYPDGTRRSAKLAEQQAQSSFEQIKDLIIKSGDIITAYSDTISKRLSGQYVTNSAFGTFREETQAEIEANSTGISQFYQNLQTLSNELANIQNQLTNAYVRTGLLYYNDDGTPMYGMEIGQTVTYDGEEVFNKFARFTSEKVSFYDSAGEEVAYISDYKLYIASAEITGSLTMGNYIIDTAHGLAFKWIGGE